tara:strand:- start:1076 stop:1363 length:288 start_codon:yes stop_codon:yes gene_type:complete
MNLELTELIEDFVETGLLSKIELDFLEAELWETIQHAKELTSLSMAPTNITKRLDLENGSSWQLCCAAVLDATRPVKESRRVELSKLIENYSLGS